MRDWPRLLVLLLTRALESRASLGVVTIRLEAKSDDDDDDVSLAGEMEDDDDDTEDLGCADVVDGPGWDRDCGWRP